MTNGPRFPTLQPEQMTPEQLALFTDISSGPRGGVRGPFKPLMYQPEIGSLVQKLGECLRFRSHLPQSLFEFSVLLAARHWSCQFEWYVHAPLAAKAGLSEDIIQAVAGKRRPSGMNADETIIYDVCIEIHTTGRLADANFDKAAARFGRKGVIEMLALCGYYSLLAFVLNVSDDPLPNGDAPPLK